MKRGMLFLVIGGLTMTVSVCGLVLLSNVVSADDIIIDQVNVTVRESCTMSGVGMNSHVAELRNNEYSAETGSTYENGIGKTTMTVFCNDYNGFSIYAVGFTGDSDSSANHTKLVGTTDNTNTISTAVHASSDTTSSWAMKITKVTDGTVAYNPINMSIQNSFDSWHAVPETYTKVAQYHANSGSSVTDTALGGKIESTYAVYVSASQIADTYEGQVKYVLVHPYDEQPLQPQTPVTGCINYFANASNAVGSMGCQSATDGNTVQLFASNFSREGYGFAGWSDAYDYASNANAHFYGPNEDIVVPSGTTANGLALYAVWIRSAGEFQDTSKVAELCGTGQGSLTAAVYNDGGDADESTWSITATLSSISALTDTRDNQTYAIAKLTDGKCWMTETLRIADTHTDGVSTVPTTLTTANTNNPLNDGTTVTLKHNYADSQTYATLSPSSNVVYNADTAPSGWCSSHSTECDDQSRIRTDNVTIRATYTDTSTSMSSHSANHFGYGNYYNWYSATAGRGTYSKSSGNTAGDLCPFGWHLPTGSGSGEFGQLSNSLGGYKNASNVAQQMNSSTSPTSAIMLKRIRHFPINLVYSGSVSGASIGSRGANGAFWLSTASNSNNGHTFYFTTSTVYPGTSVGSKYNGRSVRCTAGSSS